jgi:uncharacterized membrane protein
MIPLHVSAARGWGIEVRPGNREGIVTVALLSNGQRVQEAVALNAHEAGELARALAVALHAAGGRR